MNAQQLLQVVERLGQGIHPVTNQPFELESSCLTLPDVRASLQRLRGALQAHLTTSEAGLPDAVLYETHTELTQLGYAPTVEQMVKVLRGSRSIADPTLKAVTAYGTYRAKFSKRFIEQGVASFAERNPTLFGVQSKVNRKLKKERAPHTALPFFRENNFDKLTEEKATELRSEIDQLGFARPTDKLPDFKKRARVNYPRAYEPWSRAEQALLIEAMCYTNDANRIAEIFGRTAKSITDTGLKLIYESQRKAA